MKKFYALLIALALCACTTNYQNVQTYLDAKHVSEPQKSEFQSCRAYGCKFIDTVTLTQNEWKQIDKIFKSKTKTPEKERERLQKAIALFETFVGDQTGTHEDIGGTFKKVGTYQQDCVDESTNTTIYLKVLEQRGHIKFHEIQPPTVRLPIVNAGRWPHQTALIKQNDNEEFFAIDSWFHSNGHEPEIVPLKLWKDGWKPDSIK